MFLAMRGVVGFFVDALGVRGWVGEGRSIETAGFLELMLML